MEANEDKLRGGREERIERMKEWQKGRGREKKKERKTEVHDVVAVEYLRQLIIGLVRSGGDLRQLRFCCIPIRGTFVTRQQKVLVTFGCQSNVSDCESVDGRWLTQVVWSA